MASIRYIEVKCVTRLAQNMRPGPMQEYYG